MKASAIRVMLTIALFGIVGALSQRASAAPYTYLSKAATAVYRPSVYLAAGSHSISTTNLSTGADTVLHVLDPSYNDIGWNDDCGSSFSSCVTVSAPVTGYYTILVYAYCYTCSGTANLVIDGSTYAAGITVGGDIIAGVLNGNYTYQTAIMAGGAACTDTYLWGFDCTTGNVVAHNDDGGVGLGSLIGSSTGGYNICKVLLASYSAGTWGSTNLYVNDLGVNGDPDGDTLGELLENELQTCESGGGYTGSYCTSVINAQDTDRDALSDSYEVFGKDTHGTDPPQYLPAWGAKPRHKDLFIEADWYNATSQPMTTTDASNLSTTLAAGSASDLKNPDGNGGIAVHVDLGISSSGGTTYGSWGGASLSDTSDFNAAANSTTDFVATRRGLFRYQLFMVGGGGGQTNATANDRYSTSSANDIAHELGHTANLSHSGTPMVAPLVGGTPNYLAGEMDCKAQYPSLMNYGYPGYPTNGYSLGTNPLVTNPSNVTELHNTFPGGNGTFLTVSPWAYSVSGTSSVDWNRDGTFADSTAGGNRETTTWANFCTFSTRNMQALTGLSGNGPDCTKSITAATPKLLRVGSRLYAFYVSAADNKIHYFQGTESGNDSNGSCPGGSTYDNPQWNPAYHSPCMTWSADTTISATALNVSRFSAIASGSSVQFVYYYNSGSTFTLRALNSTSVDGSGNLTGWSGDSYLTSGGLGEPELANTFVDGSGVPVIGLYFLTSSGYQWYTTPSVGGTWTSKGAVTDGSGTSLTGSVSPSVASTSNRTCGVFTDSSSYLRFHCLDITTNRWTDYTSTMYTSAQHRQVGAKVGLAFHVMRDKNGGPLYGDWSKGQFWMMTVPSGQTNELLYTSSVLSSTILPSTSMNFPWYAWAGSYWDSVFPGTGAMLYDDTSVSALKGVLLGNGGSTSCLIFLPFADGTINETQTDVNDFQVMEHGACIGLRYTLGDGTTYCGSSPNAFGY